MTNIKLPTQHRMQAILLLLGAMAILPLMDAIAKHLSHEMSLWQITWARFTFHVLWLMPAFLARHRLRELVPARAGLQILRGLCLMASTFLFFGGVAYMPIADTLALSFVSPLTVTLLSPFLLGEKVGVRRLSAVGVGLLGALVIIRPGLGVFQPAALFGISTGLVYAFYVIITRRLAGTAPALVTLAYTALLGMIGTSLVVPFFWVPPSLEQWGLMVALGAIAALGHYLVILAYERGEASMLSPFSYAEMIGAVTVGYLIFGDFPDRWTWLGIAILIGSGVYISIREHRVSPRPPSAAKEPEEITAG
jgi:drug/metabolite transporter (DMT)-like permease